MVLNFEKEYLCQLYKTGITSDKKHRFQPGIIRVYAKYPYRREEAVVPEDLYQYQSLHFKVPVVKKNAIIR